MTKHWTFKTRLGAGLAVAALALSACGGDGVASDDGEESSDASGEKTLTFGVIPGWTDQTSTAYLLAHILEDNGYTIKMTELSDNGLMYTGLAQGDIDVLSSAWIERTHKPFMDQYGDDLADLGVYYEGADSFLAVPEYSDIKSIEDLPAHADELNGTITGIEAGAGLTKMTQESVMPAYGLDKDFNLQLSSTTAMLAELEKSIDKEAPIVVTLWSPFWANQIYPVRALEDPKNAYGDPENLHVLANKDMPDAQPEAANMLSNFTMTEEQFGSLENLVVNEFGQGNEPEAVDAWLKENPDFETELAAHLKE